MNSKTIEIGYGENGPVISFGDKTIYVWEELENSDCEDDDSDESTAIAMEKQIEIIKSFQPHAEYVNDSEADGIKTISEYISDLETTIASLRSEVDEDSDTDE